MSSPPLERLLEPSLGRPVDPPFSVRAGFFVAFLGGVFATLGFAALNARRTGRLAKDVWLIALVGLVWAGAVVWMAHRIAVEQAPGWLLLLGKPTSAWRLISRACGLAVFGLFFLRHRPLFATSELRGQDPPNPWLPGVVAVLAGSGLTFFLALLGGLLGQ
jgi:hypothetical protein